MTAHWFYLTIVAAIYTGALGPFLTSSTALEVLGYESLKDGHHSVVVRAPSWNHTVEKPKFLGDYRGGTGGTETPASTQFKILQSAMQAVTRQTQSFVIVNLALIDMCVKRNFVL
jgi:hypothetical protein